VIQPRNANGNSNSKNGKTAQSASPEKSSVAKT